MANNIAIQNAVMDWFESDFQKSVTGTTEVAKQDDGKINYNFAVVNNSGYDFSKFSFKVTIRNKTTGTNIGTATIDAGTWTNREKKTFKSKISVPKDLTSISFVIYPESLEFDAAPAKAATRTATNTRKSGGSTAKERQASRQTSQKMSTSSFVAKKQEKKLNKKRLGKSGWVVALLVFGLMFLMAVPSVTYEMRELVMYLTVGSVCTLSALFLKLYNSTIGKRIRLYESKVNTKGNTSIDELAIHAKRSVAKVADDLQMMIVEGFFPEAYVDMNNRLLVMTKNGEPIESVEKSAAMNKKARRDAARAAGVLPDDIDDLIVMTDDSQVKARLTGLRAITKRIDNRVMERPELEEQVKEFREKYYPEVVRLTDDYNSKIASLDAKAAKAKVESDTGEVSFDANPNYLQEQARKIKDQLIKLIDSVTEASENLLEKLHEDDIMDITVDIHALQATLANKGLLDSDFDL